MNTTFDVVLSGINTYVVGTLAVDVGRLMTARAHAVDGAAGRLEPGHYLDTPGGLVVATPELAGRAISWSRG